MVILLFPGSFNPPTRGHIKSIELAYKYLKNIISEITIVLSPVNSVYKEKQLESGLSRVKMTQLAAQNSNLCNMIQIDQFEALDNNEFVPSYELVQHIIAKYNTTVYFLAGTDLLINMSNRNIWPEINVKRLTSLVSLLIINRSEGVGSLSLQNVQEAINNDQILSSLNQQQKLHIITQSAGSESSTEFKHGNLSCCHDNVIQYIKDNKLYQFK